MSKKLEFTDRSFLWGINCIEENIIDQGRWTTTFERIIELQGVYYRLVYKNGSTESSGEFDDVNRFPIVAEEVQQVEKLVKV